MKRTVFYIDVPTANVKRAKEIIAKLMARFRKVPFKDKGNVAGRSIPFTAFGGAFSNTREPNRAAPGCCSNACPHLRGGPESCQ